MWAIFSAFLAPAQYVINGKIFDLKNKEPLPFVNVIIKGTTVGATSDFDGNFQIKTSKISDTIVATYIGYKRSTVVLKKTATQFVNIPMEQLAEGVSLDEVVVKAGENPAYRIVRNVIARKEFNNKRELSAYQYEAYNKLEFDLNNIPKKLTNSKAFKPIAFAFKNIDSTNSSEKPSLPIFMIESLSDFYYRDNPKLKKEIIKASKITGVENNSVSQVMGDMYQNVNVYDNDIIVFNKHFRSPISDNAIFHYKFYLEDSLYIDGKWCYHLRFKPRRSQELLFSGNIWIADSTWGVKRLEMTIPDDANINFIVGANVIQEFGFVDSTWMLTKDRLVIDFVAELGLTRTTTGIYGRKTTSYKNIVLNKPKEQSFFTVGDNIEVLEGATKKDEEYWKEVRHDSLSAREEKIYKLVDTIQSLPIYHTWVDIIQLLVAGHYDVGNFEIGPYFNLFSYNKLEGPRFRFGGRTTSKFSRWYEISGYLAYGTRDEKWKYGLGFKTFITKKPNRQLVGMNYKSDLEILGQSQNGFTNDNFFASFFRRTPLISLTRVDQTQVYYERDWFEGFNTRITFVNRKLTPVGSYRYFALNENRDTIVKNFLRTSEIRLTTRLAWGEKYINGDFSRVSLGTKNPIVQLTLVSSSRYIYEGQYEYQKIVLNVNDRIRLSALLGYTDYVVEGGKIWGKVPYPLMELHGGNQTYVYDYMAYNMMNFYEFVSDQYASFSIYHHFEGLFLNKIPIMKKLKWREVATYKILVGSVNNSNRDLLVFPSTLYALDRGPYHETSIGIENIFRFFRVDCFWRLSYLSNPRAPKWGIRAGFQLGF